MTGFTAAGSSNIGSRRASQKWRQRKDEIEAPEKGGAGRGFEEKAQKRKKRKDEIEAPEKGGAGRGFEENAQNSSERRVCRRHLLGVWGLGFRV